MPNTKIISVILTALLSLCISAYAQNNNGQTQASDLTAEEIFEMNKKCVVSIWYVGSGSSYFYVPKEDTVMLSGSGFILTSSGIIGTNNHVIENFDSLLIKTYDGVMHGAEVIATYADNDVALLKIKDSVETVYPFVSIGNVDDIKAGQPIYAIGSPMGFEFSISSGIVAAIRQNEKVSFMDYDSYTKFEKTFKKVIQITAAISPGNSGGPLFNGRGEAVGVTTYSYGFYGNLNFAVSIDNIQDALTLAKEYSNVSGDSALAKFSAEIYNRNFRSGQSYKSKVLDGWFYTKWRDTMKTYDTIAVMRDSINKVNLAKSENAYLKCMEIMPDSFAVYKELLDLYVSTDNVKMAEGIYKKVKEKFQSDSLTNSLSASLGSAYMNSKDYKQAIVFYEKIQMLDTNDNSIRYQLADIYLKAKYYDKALQKFNDITKRDPSNVKSYIQIGKIYFENKRDNTKAKKYLLTALDKNDESYMYGTEYVDLYYILGMMAVQKNKKFEAMMYYMDLKNIYTYEKEDSQKKKDLFRAIINLDD